MRNSNAVKILTGIFILIATTVAQQIDIHGRVVDEALLPVAGATVVLQSENAEVLTNNDGTFHITGSVFNIIEEPVFSPSDYIGLRKNRLEFGNHKKVEITVLSIRGEVLNRCVIEKKNGIPVQTVIPAISHSRVVLISIKTPNETFTVRAIKCGSQWLGNGANVSESDRINRRFAEGAVILDTLVVEKNGYAPHKEPLVSLLTTVNDIMLIAEREEMPSLIGGVSFSEPSKTFKEQLSVTMSASTDDVEIRYTIDGTVPVATSTLYSGTPLTITSTTQLRALAFTGETPSGEMSTAMYIARSFDYSSDIPIVIMDGYGAGKPHDKVNYIDLAFFTFEPVDGVADLAHDPTLATRAGYHLRGQSSMMFEKAPYRVELWDNENDDADYPLLGMPAEADWAMIGPYMDKTLIRNAFVYTLGRDIGLSAMQLRFAEVFINQDNSVLEPEDYQGVYTIVQTIKNQKTRLDLKQLDEEDVEPEKLSGGYIFKFDQLAIDNDEVELECTGSPKMSTGFSSFFRDTTIPLDSVATCYDDLELVDPSPANDLQIAWITGYIQQLHDALHAKPVGNWMDYIDMTSFVDLFLVNELTRDVDAYIRSHYMHKERGEPIKAGPLWDYNFALNNFFRDVEGWHWKENRLGSNDWHLIIWEQPEFFAAAKTRWRELRLANFSDASIDQYITSISAPLTNAAQRDLEKWPIGETIDIFSFLGRDDENEPETWELQLEDMKTWTKNRMHWLDSAFNATGQLKKER